MTRQIPRQPAVFISSTVKDLKPVRDTLKYFFDNVYGIRAYLSEYPDFPKPINMAIYDICIRNLERSHLVIALIDCWYGHIYETRGGVPISITRQEISVASKKRKPIWFFVSDATMEEYHKFKDFVHERRQERASHVSEESVFEEFKRSGVKPRVESLYVYWLIDEIQRLTKDNWIETFNSTYNLLTSIESRIQQFLSDFYHDAMFDLPINALTDFSEIPKRIIEYTGKSEKFYNLNLSSLALQLQLSRVPRALIPRVLYELYKTRDKSIGEFVQQQVRDMHTAITGSSGKTQVSIVDTSMETYRTDSWLTDRHHKNILEHSRQIARKYDLKSISYVRVVVVFDPSRVLIDEDWRKTLGYLIDFHQRHKIGLGICYWDLMEEDMRKGLFNSYVIPGAIVAIYDYLWDQGWYFRIEEWSSIVNEYTDLHSQILGRCSTSDGAFWVKPSMTIDDTLQQIVQLVGLSFDG